MPAAGVSFHHLRLGKPLLGTDAFDHPPQYEARALLALVDTGAMTIEQTRALIAFPERVRRALLEGGVSRHLICKAAHFRRLVMAEFDRLADSTNGQR